MKQGQTVVINGLSPEAVQALVRLSKLTGKDFGGLANCTPKARSFFRVLASHSGAIETSQLASEMTLDTRSIAPMILAVMNRLRAVGDSLERYVVRERRFRGAKPYSLYQLTDEGRKQVAQM